MTDTYEPGSTFKLVTVAAALEEGIVRPPTSFTLAPTIQVADRVIREAHSRGTERMTVEQIVEYSSNIGTITIAQRLGAGRLASWIDRFGFGKPTGIDFPGESPGFALPLDQWSGSTIGTVPIGHGIAVTPIQMARAYAAIANGGVLVRAAPRRARRRQATVATTKRRRVVSREVSEQMLVDAPRRRPRGDGHRGRDPRLHRRRQDRHRGEDRPERPLLDLALRRVVRRARAGDEAAARGHGHGRRAARRRSTAASSRRRRSREIARFNLQHLEVPPDARPAQREAATSRRAAARRGSRSDACG